MSRQSDLVAAVENVDLRARDLAEALRVVEAGLSVEIHQARNRPGRTVQEVSDSLRPYLFVQEFARHVAAIGLGPLVSDQYITAGAVNGMDRTGTFVARWTATIRRLVE